MDTSALSGQNNFSHRINRKLKILAVLVRIVRREYFSEEHSILLENRLCRKTSKEPHAPRNITISVNSHTACVSNREFFPAEVDALASSLERNNKVYFSTLE